MKILLRRYTKGLGWDGVLPPAMDSERTWVLLFCAPEYFDDPKAIQEIAARYPRSVVTGCSTAGEIFGSSISDESISAAIVKFEHSNLRVASAYVDGPDQSRAVGRSISESMVADDLRAVMVFSDGLLLNGSELLRGMAEVLPRTVVISGGLAGDGPRFKRTWVIHEGLPAAGRVSAVGFYGDRLQILAGSLGGWDVFGPERLVTKSRGNVLYELDNKPALALYKKYLGDRAADLPSSALLFPLSLRFADEGRKGLVRTVLAVNEEQNSMTFAGDVPEGAFAQLMKANFNRLVEGAEGAARLVCDQPESKGETLAVAISCVGRRLVLGTRTEAETEATLGVFPKGTAQIGFYSYGEISPLASGTSELHNQTMTLTSIREL